MVNLYEAKVGDYVLFRNKGYAKISEIEILQDLELGSIDEDDDSHSLTFEGIDEVESFTRDGKFCSWERNRTCVLDIMEIVPAEVIERELNKQKEEQSHDDIPF